MTVSDGAASATATGEAVVYDPARTLSGNGKVASPAGACTLTSACGVAGTASFSVNAKYASGASVPTTSFTFSAPGFNLSATSGRWRAAAGGKATIAGIATVNKITGYTFRLSAVDGNPDKLRLQAWSPSGALVYDSGALLVLKAGSLAIK